MLTVRSLELRRKRSLGFNRSIRIPGTAADGIIYSIVTALSLTALPFRLFGIFFRANHLCSSIRFGTSYRNLCRLERTIARDSSDKDKVRARMRMQDVEHDIQRADIIINNDGSTPVSTLCKELLELATKIEHL